MGRKKKAEPAAVAAPPPPKDIQDIEGVEPSSVPKSSAPPIKLDSLESALRARIGGRITLRIDGNDVVATGNQREARTPLDGRYPNEICDALVGGLLR